MSSSMVASNPGLLYFELKNLFGKSFIYGLGSILLKLINFLLIPIYTRFMSPEEYGIIAIVGSVLTLLLIIFSFELRGAINFFYSSTQNHDERNDKLGTIWISITVIALLLAGLADFLGRQPHLLLTKSVPFFPYLRLVIWTAFLMILGQFPQFLLQARENPIPLIVLLLSQAIINVGFSVYFIVFLRLGALGYLLGAFLSSMFMFVPYLIFTFRMIKAAFHWIYLGPIIAYSLPLVVYSVSTWLLEFSDRVIMEKFTDLGQIGLYSIGFQFGAIVNLFTSAINTAWLPLIFRLNSQEPLAAPQKIAKLTTYICAAIITFYLIISLFVKELIQATTPEEYHNAYQIALWVATGYLFNGFYYLVVNILFVRGKTQYIPMITVVSAVVGISLNILLLPKIGVIAAAWSGFLCKILMLCIALPLSRRFYPIQYEFSRIARLILIGAILLLASVLTPAYPILTSLSIKAILFLVVLPTFFYWGFLTKSEKHGLLVYISKITRSNSIIPTSGGPSN